MMPVWSFLYSIFHGLWIYFERLVPTETFPRCWGSSGHRVQVERDSQKTCVHRERYFWLEESFAKTVKQGDEKEWDYRMGERMVV